jgi:glycosyltransferase involved in cell wall biosynthesis
MVTIVHNQSRFLRQAIKFVLNQDYKNLEYIIVDLGRTDNSRE